MHALVAFLLSLKISSLRNFNLHKYLIFRNWILDKLILWYWKQDSKKKNHVFLRGYITYLLNMIHKYIWEKRNQYLTYMFKLNIELKIINELMTMLTKTHSNWYYDFDGWKKKARLNCLLMIIIFTKCAKWITIAMNVQITQYKNTISWWLPSNVNQ